METIHGYNVIFLTYSQSERSLHSELFEQSWRFFLSLFLVYKIEFVPLLPDRNIFIQHALIENLRTYLRARAARTPTPYRECENIYFSSAYIASKVTDRYNMHAAAAWLPRHILRRGLYNAYTPIAQLSESIMNYGIY